MLDDDEVMVRDVFPAEVSLSDGRLFRQVRVMVTSHRIVAWKANAETMKPEVVLNERIHYTSSPRSRGSLNIDERIEVHSETFTGSINRGKGCGCGSTGLLLKALPTAAPWSRKVNA